MGVYNPLAKMPRACGECEDRFKCEYADMTIPRRSDNCPLVEIKTPHGRLIDEETITSVGGEMKADGTVVCFNEVEAPTVIEAEVE